MDKKTLEQRVRQLQAVDLNAAEIYADLLNLLGEGPDREAVRDIAADEHKHFMYERSIISLLTKPER